MVCVFWLKELQRDADLIHTDVEYMAIQDDAELADAFKSIERMKTELHSFNQRLNMLKDRAAIVSTVYTNISKVS